MNVEKEILTLIGGEEADSLRAETHLGEAAGHSGLGSLRDPMYIVTNRKGQFIIQTSCLPHYSEDGATVYHFFELRCLELGLSIIETGVLKDLNAITPIENMRSLVVRLASDLLAAGYNPRQAFKFEF